MKIDDPAEIVVPSSTEKAAQSPARPTQVVAEEAPLPPVLQPSHTHDQNLQSVMDEVCTDRVYNVAEQAAQCVVKLPKMSLTGQFLLESLFIYILKQVHL